MSKLIIALFLIFQSLLFSQNNTVLFGKGSLYLFVQEDIKNQTISFIQDSMPIVKSDGSYCYLADEIFKKYPDAYKIPDYLCKDIPPYKNIIKTIIPINIKEELKVSKETINFMGNKIDYVVDGYPSSSYGTCGSVASVEFSLKVNGITFFHDSLLEKWCSTNININKIDLNFKTKEVILLLSYANLIEGNEKFEEIKSLKIPFSYFEENTISHFSLRDLAKILNDYCKRNYNCRYYNIEVEGLVP